MSVKVTFSFETPEQAIGFLAHQTVAPMPQMQPTTINREAPPPAVTPTPEKRKPGRPAVKKTGSVNKDAVVTKMRALMAQIPGEGMSILRRIMGQYGAEGIGELKEEFYAQVVADIDKELTADAMKHADPSGDTPEESDPFA